MTSKFLLGCLPLVALLVAFPPGGASAAPTAEVRHESFSARQVGAAVETWVRKVSADARPEASIKNMEPYLVDGETLAYIAHLNDGGFCLAGADSLVLPVYLYSPHGTYDPTSPDLKAILNDIAGRSKWNRQTVAAGDQPVAQELGTLFTERAALWNALMMGLDPAASAAPGSPQSSPPPQLSPNTNPPPPTRMELPLTSTWHQHSPYNDQLPELTPGADEHTIVGCNATATAQIMYYWKWPITGVGTGSVSYPYRYRTTWDSEPLAANPFTAGFANRLEYDATTHRLRMNGYWDSHIHECAINLAKDNTAYQTALAALWGRMTATQKTAAADFGAATYGWNLMRNSHADPVDAGDIEVAKLNAHVSIAVNSRLGVWDTTSFFGNDVAALRDHFRYDPDALFTDTVKNGGSGATPDALIEEIQWSRPTGLGGTNLTTGGGHAWVVHGYDAAPEPDQFLMNLGGSQPSSWYTFDNCPFPANHDMMTRIAPLNVKFVGATVAGDGSPNSPYRDVQEALSEAPNGSTLIFKAGSVNVFSSTNLVINRPLVLKGWNSTVTK